MSIEALLNTSISGLAASQAALRTTSDNVANVNTPNYVRQETILSPTALDGEGSGVVVEDVRRVLDTYYYGEALTAASESSEANVIQRTQDRLQAFFGPPADNSAFPGRIEDFYSSISSLTVEPESLPLRIQAINDLDRAGQSLQSTMDQIASLRAEADRQIVSIVEETNALLQQIAALNVQIERGDAAGRNVNGLLDQQDSAIARLSEFIDVRVERRDSGRADVSTSDGLQLVTLGASQLSYQGASGVSEGTVFPPIEFSLTNPQNNTPIGTPRNFNSQIKSGELRGLLDLRDTILPNYSDQVSAVAAAFADQANAAHNDSAAVPPPNVLAGRNTGLIAGDAHNFSGATTLSVVDGDGLLVRRVDVDFDAGTYSVDGGGAVAFGATIGDLQAALNTALGPAGSASFAGGALTVSAADPTHGVAFKSDDANPAQRAGRGLSHFFGLNDLVSSQSPTHFATGLTGADAHGFTTGATIDFVLQGPRGQQIERTVTVPAGATFNDLLTAVNTPGTGIGDIVTVSLSADGELQTSFSGDYTGYRLLVAEDTTARSGSSVSFSSLFGLNPQTRADQSRGFSARADIADDPGRFAVGQLNTDPALAIGEPAVTPGDNRGVLALEASRDQRITFPAAGGQPAMFASISEYAAQTLSSFALDARAAEETANDLESLRTDIEARRGEVQGVNLDEELATMLIYQQAYNASARLISTAQELYDALMNVV